MGPLPKTKDNNEFILTMQDQLSKFSLADALIKKFISIFGARQLILTDQGQNFLRSLIHKVSKRFKIIKVETTAFHPQSNGAYMKVQNLQGTLGRFPNTHLFVSHIITESFTNKPSRTMSSQ